MDPKTGGTWTVRFKGGPLHGRVHARDEIPELIEFPMWERGKIASAFYERQKKADSGEVITYRFVAKGGALEPALTINVYLDGLSFYAKADTPAGVAFGTGKRMREAVEDVLNGLDLLMEKAPDGA